MAELVLTEAEKLATTYVEWDDASLGRAVKRMALAVNDEMGTETINKAAMYLTTVTIMRKMNAETLRVQMKELVDGEIKLGDWDITVKLVQPGRIRRWSKWSWYGTAWEKVRVWWGKRWWQPGSRLRVWIQ